MRLGGWQLLPTAIFAGGGDLPGGEEGGGRRERARKREREKEVSMDEPVVAAVIRLN